MLSRKKHNPFPFNARAATSIIAITIRNVPQAAHSRPAVDFNRSSGVSGSETKRILLNNKQHYEKQQNANFQRLHRIHQKRRQNR